MRNRDLWAVLIAVVTFAAVNLSVSAKEPMAELKEGTKIADFKAECVYENDRKQVVGARLRHVPTGFVLDLMRIQSVPQAFVWVNTPPPSDQGEPHTLEHLLLGKGTKGKYVGSLEEVNLGESSAFTMQVQTCYHYHTTAGNDIFFELFEAKMDAMMHPNFTDEEIRREVANMGLAQNADGSWRLEEKGTVYNEMFRGFESPWGEMSQTMDRLVYGMNHTLSYNSGGYPPAIWTMTPDDIRHFQQSYYTLNNMGAVVTIPDQIELQDCLTRFSAMFKRLSPNEKPGKDPSTFDDRIPKANPGEEGTIKQTSFPHANASEPGMVMICWPPDRMLGLKEELLYRLFMDGFSAGQTSNLFKLFVNSETKKVDVGVDAIYSWTTDFPGLSPTIALNNVGVTAMEMPMLDSLRRAVTGEMKRVASFADGSSELKEFNDRLKNLVIDDQRQTRVFLNTPPTFGRRGTGSGWFDHLMRVQKEGGFRRSLTFANEAPFIDSVLSSAKNLWKEYLAAWQLTTKQPFVVAARPDTALNTLKTQQSKARIAKFTEGLKEKYGVATDSLALARFKVSYDSMTAVIDSISATIETPKFVENPPLTLDDYLNYESSKLPGGGALVSSIFSNYSGGTVGFAFDASVIPDSLLVYVPILPSLIRQVGVLRGDKPVSFDQMSELLRKEILSLYAYYSVNYRTQRVELAVNAAGSDSVELAKAIGWLETALFNPDLRQENIARIQDVVALNLSGNRDRMKGGEEGWVDEPANAYWRQTNPVILSANCFLTEAFHLQRLKWQLKESTEPGVTEAFTFFMTELSKYSGTADRPLLREMLDALMGTSKQVKVHGGAAKTLLDAMVLMKPEAIKLVQEAAKDINRSLDDVPDNSLTEDWAYLCKQILADYKMPAKDALSRIGYTLSLLRHADNVRAFSVTSPEMLPFVKSELGKIASKLDTKGSAHPAHSSTPVITTRLKERMATTATPVFVGLLNENTRSGVHYNTAALASYADTDPSKLLDFLAGRIYGGHGSHTVFTQTIGAGLAYSNGIRARERDGRLWYYAERCPDLAQTMDFVVKAVQAGPRDPALGDYAVAQAFLISRAAHAYDERGEGIAEDLTDGVGPEIVKRYHRGMLELRKDPHFYDSLYARKERVHGRVLPGYGDPAANDMRNFDANFFVIGPEKQLSNYDQYLKQVEGTDAVLFKLYPRDYWIIGKTE